MLEVYFFYQCNHHRHTKSVCNYHRHTKSVPFPNSKKKSSGVLVSRINAGGVFFYLMHQCNHHRHTKLNSRRVYLLNCQ